MILEELLCLAVLWLKLALTVNIPAGHPLHDSLHHFEVLHVSQISHHSPPHTSHTHTSPRHNNRETTHVHFRTLKRDFNLILTPSLRTVHNLLQVTVVSDTGEEKRPFPFTSFYSGHLLGSPDSHVTAQFHPQSGVMTAAIHTSDEVYYVEPLARHSPGSHDSHMISYRHSHVKFNLTGESPTHFCGNSDHHLPNQIASAQQTTMLKSNINFLSHKVDGAERQRLKRGLNGDVCTLHLVATPSFHSQTSTDPDTTALFLLGLISDIDLNIFQSTEFTTNPSRLGLVVTNCLQSVYCMGEKTCPQNLTFDLEYVPENTTCGQLGRCLPPGSKCDVDGVCTTAENPEKLVCYNFCQWHGSDECFCTGSEECKFCCIQTAPGIRNQTCALFDGTSRPDHSSCIGGFCETGECVPGSQDLIQRLFMLFNNPSLDTFVMFMRENIVGTIVILTALLWIPASFFVNIFDVYRWRKHKRVALEYEADLQDAELEDEDDLHFYDNVFEEMEHTQPGVLRPEARLGLMRLDSGTFEDYFGSDDPMAPLTPHVPVTTSAPYSGFWEHRLSTITEESGGTMNPERDNIHLYNIQTPLSGSGNKGGGALKRSSLDTEPGTLV